VHGTRRPSEQRRVEVRGLALGPAAIRLERLRPPPLTRPAVEQDPNVRSSRQTPPPIPGEVGLVAHPAAHDQGRGERTASTIDP
jgi:hypothetical protein